jgi:hypothetical protein
VTDQYHDHFEIERSTDGSDYHTLGRYDGSAPYKFIDQAVQAGNNYYRIKQIDKDGKITYSQAIKIVYDPSKAIVTIYPNPVQDELNMRVSVIKRSQMKITLTDAEGKVVYKKSGNVEPGINDIKINMRSITSQVYILRVTDSNGEIITTEKVIKL